MNIDATLEVLTKFFSEGFGRMVADFLRIVFDFLYPANAEAASIYPSVQETPKP